MRSFIKHAACSAAFIAGLTVLLLIASAILDPLNNVKNSGIKDEVANEILCEPDDTIDVLFLGDSETYNSVIPLKIWEQYKITSFCCATQAQKLCYSLEFAYKAFKKQSPKIVLLEGSTILREFSFPDMILYKANRIMPVFNYHDRWKPATPLNSKPLKYIYVEDSKGYKLIMTANAASTKGYMEPSDKCAAIPRRNREYAESIKEFCEKNGARLIIISTPSTLNWNTEKHNSIEKLAGELKLEYIDMNMLTDEIQIDWKNDTRDKGDHMNFFGAQKVTAYLGKYLSETGILCSHEGDESYAYWDDQLESFNSIIDSELSK